MVFSKKFVAFIFAASLLSANFIQTAHAESICDMEELHAGAGAILIEEDVAATREKRLVDVAYVNSVVGDDEEIVEEAPEEEEEESESGISLDKDDPIYKLFGNSVVMSNVNDSVNIRKEPSEEAELVGKLYHNCAGKLVDSKDGWSQIESGGFTGWIKNDYLFFGEEALNLARQEGAVTATVETETLRIRENPNENSSTYGLLAEGEKIEVIEDMGGWMKIAYSDDTEGYISSEYVSTAYEIDEAESIEAIRAREEAEKEKERKEKEKRAKVEASRTKTTVTTNTGATAASTDDVTLLAALIQAECGNEIYEGKLAVGAVVVNRAKGRYGSIANAIYAPGQFGPAASGKVALIASVGPTAECRRAATEAISGTTNVGPATHFRNIRSGYAGIVIGNHVFW